MRWAVLLLVACCAHVPPAPPQECPGEAELAEAVAAEKQQHRWDLREYRHLIDSCETQLALCEWRLSPETAPSP